MKGLDRSIWKLACFTIFVCLPTLQAFVTMISLHLTHSTTGGETAKKCITNFKIKMSQFIAQMFQAGAVTECAAALLSFRHPSFTGKPEQNITTKIYAKRDDGSVV